MPRGTDLSSRIARDRTLALQEAKERASRRQLAGDRSTLELRHRQVAQVGPDSQAIDLRPLPITAAVIAVQERDQAVDVAAISFRRVT